MALFFVVALKASAPLIEVQIAARIPVSEYYKIEDGKWIVNATVSTSKELSDLLEITATLTHFTLPVRGYFGRAQPDLWEWLAAKTSKANG